MLFQDAFYRAEAVFQAQGYDQNTGINPTGNPYYDHVGNYHLVFNGGKFDHFEITDEIRSRVDNYMRDISYEAAQLRLERKTPPRRPDNFDLGYPGNSQAKHEDEWTKTEVHIVQAAGFWERRDSQLYLLSEGLASIVLMPAVVSRRERFQHVDSVRRAHQRLTSFARDNTIEDWRAHAAFYTNNKWILLCTDQNGLWTDIEVPHIYPIREFAAQAQPDPIKITVEYLVNDNNIQGGFRGSNRRPTLMAKSFKVVDKLSGDATI